MTDRKFTPPTEFPAEYVTRDGKRAVILGERPCVAPYVGYVVEDEADSIPVITWHSSGSYLSHHTDDLDLHDLPKKHVHWANDYETSPGACWYESRQLANRHCHPDRIGLIRREWVEGQPPQYFTEEV